jgi:hypothetical protein
VDPEGHVAWLQNFYSVPWQRIGELLPVRITENELIVYGPDVKEIARHELFSSGITGQKRTLPEHSPGRDLRQKRELLKQRFAEFGPQGVVFFDELLRTRHHGKDEASRVLRLLTVYRREDLTRALERAVRYRAFSWSAVERILAVNRRGPARGWNHWPSKPRNISRRFCSKLLWLPARRRSISRCSKKRPNPMKMKKTTPKTMSPADQLRDRCQNHFLTLRIPVEPAALDELLARAEKENLSHLRFLDLLLGAQADARRERAVARRIRDAHFAENKTLEGFSWDFNPKAFDRVQIEELATGDFIRRRTNLVLVGWSGVGKSHIIQALGQKACLHGYRVWYRTSAQLLADLTASLADRTLPAKLRRYASPDLLVID